jgi:hypothetical protein
MTTENIENKKLPFPERLKAESKGFGLLPKEFVEKHKSKELGYSVQVARRLGRPITDKESRMMNI